MENIMLDEKKRMIKIIGEYIFSLLCCDVHTMKGYMGNKPGMALSSHVYLPMRETCIVPSVLIIFSIARSRPGEDGVIW